jgi:hypothetical protein
MQHAWLGQTSVCDNYIHTPKVDKACHNDDAPAMPAAARAISGLCNLTVTHEPNKSDDGRLIDVARRAIDAGVILDIGHGAGSCAFRTAEAALAAGTRPHGISTDMHQMSVAGPMFDLPTCLSKFFALGLSVRDVVAMATEGPAHSALRGPRHIARRCAGRHGLFRLHEGVFPFYDNTGEMRSGRQLLRNVKTIVGGRVLERRPASPRAVWAEHWARGGTNARIRAFQCELVAKGHTPEQMRRCSTVLPGQRGNGRRSALASLTQRYRTAVPPLGEMITQDPRGYGEVGSVFMSRERHALRRTDSSRAISVRSLRFSRTVRRRVSISVRNLPRSLATLVGCLAGFGSAPGDEGTVLLMQRHLVSVR